MEKVGRGGDVPGATSLPSRAASYAAHCPAHRPRRCPHPHSSAGRESAPAPSHPSALCHLYPPHSCPRQGAEGMLVLPGGKAPMGGCQGLVARAWTQLSAGLSAYSPQRSLDPDHTQGSSPSLCQVLTPTRTLIGPQPGSYFLTELCPTVQGLTPNPDHTSPASTESGEDKKGPRTQQRCPHGPARSQRRPGDWQRHACREEELATPQKLGRPQPAWPPESPHPSH